jgi:hypothetical protein
VLSIEWPDGAARASGESLPSHPFWQANVRTFSRTLDAKSSDALAHAQELAAFVAPSDGTLRWAWFSQLVTSSERDVPQHPVIEPLPATCLSPRFSRSVLMT